MKELKIALVMDGKLRKVNVKEKVNGYRHEINVCGDHQFIRGGIIYEINEVEENPTFTKQDKNGEYLSFDYDEVHKFINMEVIGEAPPEPRLMDNKEFSEYLSRIRTGIEKRSI